MRSWNLFNSQFINNFSNSYAVGIFLSFSVTFLALFKYDDGWATLTIDNYLITSKFSYVIYYNDIEYTFQKVWFWILSLIRSRTNNIFALRGPALVLTFCSWLLLRNTIQLALNRPPPFIATFFWWYSSYVFLITLRAEPFLVCILSLLIWCFTFCFIYKKSYLLTLFFPITGFAIASHPLGFFIFFLTIYFFLIIIFSSNSDFIKSYQPLFFIFSIVTTLFIAYRLTLWNLSLPDFIHLFKIVSNEATHNQSYLNELIRYKYLLDRHYEYAYFLFTLCILSLYPLTNKINYSELHDKSFNISNYLIFIVSIPLIFYFIFLTFYPAKWEHYFALIIPFIYISISFFFTCINFFKLFAKSFSFAFIMSYSLFFACYPAVFFSFAKTQNSYLKSWLFDSTASFDVINKLRPNDKVLIVPYLYPYFKFKRENLFSLDINNFYPNYLITDCNNCSDFIIEQFHGLEKLFLINSFNFNGNKLFLYSLYPAPIN